VGNISAFAIWNAIDAVRKLGNNEKSPRKQGGLYLLMASPRGFTGYINSRFDPVGNADLRMKDTPFDHA
jgi:hypothetical protein